MAYSFMKFMLTNATLLCCFCLKTSSPSPTFLFPDTIESETGGEIFISKLNDDQTCIPLGTCSQLAWLAREIPAERYISQILSPKNISRTLKSKRCVINEADSEQEVTMQTRVVCPKIHDISVDTDKNDCGVDCNDEEDYEVRTVFELERRTSIECSIQLQHGELDDPLNDLQIKFLSGKRKKYHNLKRLAERRVLRVTADGFCCWRVYQKVGFRGDSSFVEPDDEIFPDHLVKSTRQVECDEEIID